MFDQYKNSLTVIHDQVIGLANKVENCEKLNQQQFKKAKRDMKAKIR